MNKKLIIAPVVLTALLVAGYFIDRARSEHESRLSGFFESQPSVASSRIGGRVSRILVHEGDSVKAGQPLVDLEDASYAASYEAQLKASEQANQQYLETARGARQEEVAKALHARDAAAANYDKLRNGSRPEEIASARERAAQAEAQYRKVLSGSRPEEIAAARASADVALAKLQQAERGLTAEERNQLKARLDAALADEVLAKKQSDRTQFLFDQGAVSKQQLDSAESAYQQATARRQDAEQAYHRAQAGTPKEELAQARQGFQQAEAQLRLVRKGSRPEDIEAARQDMLMARQSLALVMKGPREEDLRAAKAQLDQADSAYRELARGNRPEDIAKARAAHDQAVLQAKSTKANLNERVVTASTDAVVDRVLIADGDLVAAGSPVIQLSYPSDIWLRVYLPESQLGKVKVGDAAELLIDGIQGSVAAVVENIATSGEYTPANLQSPEERGKQVFAVRIRLARPDGRVKAGMYATVKRVGQWP